MNVLLHTIKKKYGYWMCVQGKSLNEFALYQNSECGFERIA